MLKNKAKSVAAITIGLLGGLAVGMFSLTNASAEPSPPQEPAPVETLTVEQVAAEAGVSSADLVVRTNSDGETYGSGLVNLTGAPMPDLVLVIMDNGEQGYVYASELFAGPVAANPTEAIQIAQEQAAAARSRMTSSQTVTAYDAEGNPIGTFTVNN